jgi:transcriptional regulator with XRE-family HTH domain
VLPVGAKLRSAREACSLSREALARLSDCSTSRVEQFELGLRPAASPALERVWAVIAVLRERAEGGDA